MRFYVNVNGTLAEIGDGKSAYELAVYYGYTGTEQEWLESLHGKDGSTVTLDTSTKHWFIDKAVQKDGTFYKLEGYLYPNTYVFKNKNVTINCFQNGMSI